MSSLSLRLACGRGAAESRGGGFSANQVSRQQLNAQLTRVWCRRIAVSERTWESARPSWSLTCL
jgi:hypothetical protein